MGSFAWNNLCVRHKHQIGYTTSEVLWVHLQVPCPFPSRSSAQQAPWQWGCFLGQGSGCCESECDALGVSTVHAPGARHLSSQQGQGLSRQERDMMLLQHYSKTPLVSTGITNTSASCTLRIEMDFFILPRKFIVLRQLFYQISFSHREIRQWKQRITSKLVCIFDNKLVIGNRYHNKVFFTSWLIWFEKNLHCLICKIFNFLW